LLASVQQGLARDIASKLQLNLGGDTRAGLNKLPTSSGEAYDLYLKGRYSWNKLGVPDLALFETWEP